MIDTNESDAILSDILSWCSANTNRGKSQLPKTLHDHFDRLYTRYEQAVCAENCQQLSHRTTLEQIWKMLRGELLENDIEQKGESND